MSEHELAPFIAGLPKAELHVHHVGSASPRIVSELAQRHPSTAVPTDVDQLADYFQFDDFAKFVEIYLTVVDLVRTPDDVRMLTYEIAREMSGQNIRYAELTCSPYTSITRGIDPNAYCEALEDARVSAERDFAVVLRWCFDIPGEDGVPAADETARVATEIAPDGLVSFGLGGPEIGWPRPLFKPAFDRAIATGLHSVPHAGESTGPQTIWDSIRDLRAERIGHGTSSTQDSELLAYLAEHDIALEVCPTSNVATRVVPSLDQHPVRDMAAAGVAVTINSDDPPMFGTTLNREYAIAADLLGLDQAGLGELARTAVRASFADDALKQRLTAEIDDYVARAVTRAES